ncbi:MAG: acetyl-CoA carboxylase biotin carboxyl carrier protein subunit [Flavobacteriales bacterium]|jgi:acetyl/propionyl-CoA carboxylase alpha subunit|nr:acetyl-CoA carboxylase biotin carboxyl carrier protein subunit [Flavobacteriales bacterium]
MAQRVVVSEKDFLIEFSNDEQTSGTINGKDFELDVRWLSDSRLHVIKNAGSYEVELLPDVDGKRQISINGNIYGATVVGKFDELLKKMGMQNGSAGKVSAIKAPMPGMVLEVAVKVGDSVQKGDRLLVLEAMKMENVIKSPADAVIASVEVEQGKTVDKNEVMVKFA